MPFSLKPLPYAKSALSPAISATTMELHYEKHHRGYVDKLNKLTAGSLWADLPLAEVISGARADPAAASIFNNAAQVWNHDFFWLSMSPQGGLGSVGSIGGRLEAGFGSYEKFEAKFVESALAQFGSGWAWLVTDEDGLKVITTDDAVTPMVLGFHPLLTCDLWEHAYYLDYQNNRERFVRAFLARLTNWSFAAEQLAAEHSTKVAA